MFIVHFLDGCHGHSYLLHSVRLLSLRITQEILIKFSFLGCHNFFSWRRRIWSLDSLGKFLSLSHIISFLLLFFSSIFLQSFHSFSFLFLSRSLNILSEVMLSRWQCVIWYLLANGRGNGDNCIVFHSVKITVGSGSWLVKAPQTTAVFYCYPSYDYFPIVHTTRAMFYFSI